MPLSGIKMPHQIIISSSFCENFSGIGGPKGLLLGPIKTGVYILPFTTVLSRGKEKNEKQKQGREKTENSRTFDAK